MPKAEIYFTEDLWSRLQKLREELNATPGNSLTTTEIDPLVRIACLSFLAMADDEEFTPLKDPPGGERRNLECTCELGHRWIPKKNELITADLSCPVPVYGDGEIALRGRSGDPDPFSNPAVKPCGSPIEGVYVDIDDYEARRWG